MKNLDLYQTADFIKSVYYNYRIKKLTVKRYETFENHLFQQLLGTLAGRRAGHSGAVSHFVLNQTVHQRKIIQKSQHNHDALGRYPCRNRQVHKCHNDFCFFPLVWRLHP